MGHTEEMQAELLNEKKRRVYYQDIVYAVCRDIDKILPGATVCGSPEEPSTEVQDRMKAIRKVLCSTWIISPGGNNNDGLQQ